MLSSVLIRQPIDHLTPEELASEIGRGDLLLVDVREPAERRSGGALAGAVHAPRALLEFYADPASPYHRLEFDPSHRTVVYCASGGRSALAAEGLRRIGYRNVAQLDGGLAAWTASGKPVEPSLFAM